MSLFTVQPSSTLLPALLKMTNILNHGDHLTSQLNNLDVLVTLIYNISAAQRDILK